MQNLSPAKIFIATIVVGAVLIGGLVLATGQNFSSRFTLPLKIEEYFDYACIHCYDLQPTMEQIESKFGTDVQIEYKYFQIFSQSRNMAIAAEAAREQSKYSEYHKAAYAAIEAAGGVTAVPSIDLIKLADELDLDIDKFEADMAKTEVIARVDASTTEGQNKGVSGTPALFINGASVRIQTDPDDGGFDNLITRIEDLIKNAKK